MHCSRHLAAALLVVFPSVSALAQPAAPAAYTIEQVRSYPFPNELTAAATGSRIAWVFNEEGKRNVWVAEGPRFEPRQLSHYSEDDGQELTSVSLSANGKWVVYVRGGEHGGNWSDIPPNPASSTVAPTVQIWVVPYEGGAPKVLVDGDAPVISPRSDVVAFERGGQIWTVPIDGSSEARRLFFARGNVGGVQWSPDGSELAFVAGRGDHAFIGIFSGDSMPIRWIAPSTSRDASPRWSRDGTRLVFIRRPGAGGAPEPLLEPRHSPWAIWVADARTGSATQLWKAPETLRGSVPSTHGGTNLHWAAGDRVVFLSYVDGWPHLYSIAASGGEPLLLTPGDYMAEYIQMSPDGRYAVFAGNAGSQPDDIDRRHIVKAPVDRSAPEVLTPGSGLEWTPVVTGDGATIAFLGATAQRPPLPAVIPAAGGTPRLIAEDRIPADFPTRSLVTPRRVTFKAPDGVTVRGQLFEAPGGATKKPAIIYVHGGPPRQMLLGWHYSDYYSNAYASNQYLASRGYVVLSVNYRLGIGYGYDFHRPPDAGARGASEYLDVKAAGEYLQRLPQVDPARIGIYGGSYGGYLTALALARDSDLFAAGVDIHGVHDFTAEGGRRIGGTEWRYEPTDREQAAKVAWESSPVASIDSWKSPVLLIHADDDRNVRFSQTVDLVQRLEAADVPYEVLVIPDDTHHFFLHANWLIVNRATSEFFDRTIGGRPSPAVENGRR